nr:PREDICTED: uncharacterized protein LOC103548044 [Equus przewalskii]
MGNVFQEALKPQALLIPARLLEKFTSEERLPLQDSGSFVEKGPPSLLRLKVVPSGMLLEQEKREACLSGATPRRHIFQALLEERQHRWRSRARAPVGGAVAPHCSILAAERSRQGRAELASCGSPSAASRSERERGHPRRAAPTCCGHCSSHRDCSPATRKRSVLPGLRSVGGFSGPGGLVPNLQGTAALPGLESVNRIADSSKIYNDMVNSKAGAKIIFSAL